MWHKMLEQLPDHEYKADENKNKNVMTPKEKNMLPDIEFLQKLTNEKKMQDIAEKKKLTDEFINLPEVRETLLDRAENGCDSASLRVPPVYMKAIAEIKKNF